MKIRLTRKFSQLINGIDLSHVHEGDTIDLSQHDADMLVAEGWAVAESEPDRAHERSRTRRPARKISRKSAKKKR